MASFFLVTRLKKVDLPTLGLPTIATIGFILCFFSRLVEEKGSRIRGRGFSAVSGLKIVWFCHAADYQNTLMLAAVPPTAKMAVMEVDISSGASLVDTLRGDLASSNSGDNLITEPIFSTGTADAKEFYWPITWYFSYPTVIRNHFMQDAVAADSAGFYFYAFEE